MGTGHEAAAAAAIEKPAGFDVEATFVEARNSGETSFGTAKTPEAIDAVIRNNAIQGTLSILFAVLVVVVVAAAVVTCAKAVRLRRAGEVPATSEEPDHPSMLFAPASMVATAEEKHVMAALQ